MLSSLIPCNNNEPLLNGIVMCDKKWILYDNWRWPAQWLDRDSSTALPKARLASEKVSRLLFAALLPIWSTKAFWIPVKPLHLRNSLSKSRCTEHCNACRRHWSTERVQLFSATTPDCTSHNQGFKSWTNRVLHSASSARFTWPLALLLLQESQSFAEKMLP